jgi:hypothetical protein
MADKISLQHVFQRHLDSQELPAAIRSVVQLIASGALSREGFDRLLETEQLSNVPLLKESLLDLILLFTRECIQDHELSTSEIDELQTLVTVFRIEEGDFYALRRDAVEDIINAQGEWILKDRYVTEQEEILQRDLQRLFGLGYDQYVAILRPLASERIEELESRRQAVQDREELRSIDSSIRNLRGIFLISG